MNDPKHDAAWHGTEGERRVYAHRKPGRESHPSWARSPRTVWDRLRIWWSWKSIPREN